jgi:hypothetical protein
MFRATAWMAHVSAMQHKNWGSTRGSIVAHSGVGTGTGETDMALQKDLSELERKHQALKREIEDEMSHLGADDLKLAALKRRKLQLKDEIEKLRCSDQRSIH